MACKMRDTVISETLKHYLCDAFIKVTPRLERLNLSGAFEENRIHSLEELYFHRSHVICDDLKSLLNGAKATLAIFTLLKVTL